MAIELPFELDYRKGAWRAFWQEHGLRVAVAGPGNAPDPDRMAALHSIVARWADVQQTIRGYLRSYEGHVPLSPPQRGGLDASFCGFDELVIGFLAITVDDEDDSTVRVHFATGLPDGYMAYRVALREGEPFAVDAYPS